MPSNSRSCETCAHYEKPPYTPGGEELLEIPPGECRRNAPHPYILSPESIQAVLVWPNVKSDDYCGEYEKNDDIDGTDEECADNASPDGLPPQLQAVDEIFRDLAERGEIARAPDAEALQNLQEQAADEMFRIMNERVDS